VTTNTNSSANGWSNFPQQQQQQQQQNINHPSRSNAPGNSNVSSNQWPQIDNFYGPNSSTGGSFNLPANNNNNSDTMNPNSGSLSTWQDPSASGNAGETMNLTSSNSSVINKHKSSSSNASIAASLSVALKSAIASGGATADSPGGNGDPPIVIAPQPRLVEQLGWDEPEIKVAKRPAFDDGTSIWGDPMDSAAVPVKKWTNGTKAALSNSTNTVVQQPQPSAVQKPVSTGTHQGSTATPPTTQMGMNNENWPKQQSPTIMSQPAPSSSSSSQWNEASASNDQISLGSASQQQMNYRSQQSNNSNWNSLPQASGGHGGSDDWIRDGVVDTSDWCLQNSQNKVPFDPFDGKVDTSDWVVSGGPSGGMGGQMPMPSMNRNRFGQDYDLNEGSHDPHNVHRLSNFEPSPMGDPYRQGSDLKNTIIGVGSLLPSAGGNPQLPHHMLPPSQLPFNARPGPMYQQSGILRPINPNGIPTQSGAIMGTGGLISPKLSTTSPVPNQAPYVPLSGKPGNMSNQAFPSGNSQQQSQGGAGGGGGGGAGTSPMNNGAVHAQIMQQFRLAVQAGLISQDLLNTKLPPFMLQLLQKLFELQQKYQALSIQLADFAKHKQRFPITFFQSEYERLSKLLSQKKQEMLMVQKQIHDAHTKLKQQQSTNSTPTPSQMMVNGPAAQSQTGAGVSQESQHGLTTDQSRLHQWTKSSAGGGNTRSGQSQASMFGPPGLTRKEWDNSNNNLNENWENTPTNDSTNSNSNNPGAHGDAHLHNSQGASSAFPDPLADFVDDNDGPPPFVPGQLWNWKASLPSADDDPHVTPSSLTLTSKGSSTSINSLNASGNESAFSHPQIMQRQQQQQQQQQRSQWQQSLQDQQAFQGASMSDWGKPQQFRGPPKGPSSLNHPPPPPHASFGGYRPYM